MSEINKINNKFETLFEKPDYGCFGNVDVVSDKSRNKEK